MANARGCGRLGLLAVGLGIGAALATIPRTASADSSTDWLSSIDNLLGGLSVPAAMPSALDVQISIDGMELFSTAGNTATATSGTGDIAIAIGNGSIADATGGTGDFALADGTNSDAGAGGTGPFGGDGIGSNDIAIDIGNNNGSLLGANAIGGDNDTAILFGNLTGNFAGVEAGNPGNSDFALAIGNEDGFDDGPYAGEGHNNVAIDIGNETGDNLGANASPSAGSFDFAGVFGNNDTATAGSPGDFDLAAVFGDGLNATASGGNFLVDIVPSL